MKQKIFQWTFHLSLLSSLSTRGADFHVFANASSFSPNTVQIAVGDTVTWENNDPFFPHTTTSDLQLTDPNYWNGFIIDQGDTFTTTFNAAGTYTYHDTFDDFAGTVIVIAPSAGIELSNPRRESGQFNFEATGLTVGKTNILQASTNLTAWVAIKTNVAAASTVTFTNTMTQPARCFRLLQLP